MMLTWLYGGFLTLLLPVVAVFCILLLRRFLWQKRTAHLLGGSHAALLKNFSLIRKVSKTVLLMLSLLFLVLALARPQGGSQTQVVSQEGRDLLIALDVSRSMLAQDSKPSRLEQAKSKIRELLSRLTAERVSLLIFSGVALVQCPFTTDMNAFLNFLDLTGVEEGFTGTTALDAALTKALTAFEVGSSHKRKLMILFTDGEDFSVDLPTIKKKAGDLGLKLFIVGVGTPEGAPIPLYDDDGVQQGHQKDEQGAVVITRLNEPLLADLAAGTGGAYLRLTDNDTDIRRLISHVSRFEKEKFSDTTLDVKNEQYGFFAAVCALLLVGDWIL